ncbi:MAG: hypothetical protein KAI24_06955 [Planctomycetes bacterium]|nr:hypothetical protein [Planctomycetota bacterium]
MHANDHVRREAAGDARRPLYDPEVHRYAQAKARWGARLPRRGLWLLGFALVVIVTSLLLAML